KQIEFNLQIELEKNRTEIEKTRTQMKEMETRLITAIKQGEGEFSKALHRQTVWLVGSIGLITTVLRLLDMYFPAGGSH
ncbi:MAG: hypothetical protein ACR2HF_06280, partial [Methylococcaceae bacterium]